MRERTNDDIQHFVLTGILPQGHILAVRFSLGIMARLVCEAGAPHVLTMHHFGDVELLVLLPLLQEYPRYCRSEVLLATFTSTEVTPAAVERAREQLDKASWEQVMKPVRDVLSRCRPRLYDLGLIILSRVKQGYQLAAVKTTLV